MNSYFIKLLSGWIWTLCLSMFSISGTQIYTNSVTIENKIVSTTLEPITSTVVKYDTVTKYNSKLPANRKNILVEGKDGLVYTDKKGNIKKTDEAVQEVIEIGTGAQGIYSGNTTGYGGDCIGCSGRVSCRTREGQPFNLNQEGIYYNDNQYGSVRILAADLSLFKCGTVIEVNNGRGEPFLGIVMDTGSGMRESWRNHGLVHVDIAHETEKDPIIYQATSKNAEFSVQRWGW